MMSIHPCHLMRSSSNSSSTAASASFSLQDFAFPQPKVGAKVDDDRTELFLSQVRGKDITELIASSWEKLSSVSTGGAGVAKVVDAPTGGAGDATPTGEATKEEVADEGESVASHVVVAAPAPTFKSMPQLALL